VKTVTNYKNQEVLSRYEYDYDNNGNITTVSEQMGSEPPRISRYQYDELDRLKTITRWNETGVTYTYNARGDRTVAEGYVPQLDKTDADYTFNEWNQLTRVVRNGETITFQYDASGLRSQKTSSAGTRRYIYEPGGRLLAEKDASNQMLASYIWGPDRLLFRKNADDQVYYYLYNGHGDVVQIVDAAGSIVNQYRYDEWGRITEQTETVPNEFKYAGETCDAETGLYYLRARYYDPDTGRFISKDSMEGDLWNPLSQNLYTYCENDPLGNVDPWGQAVKPLRELATQYQASRISYDWRTRTATITIGGTTRNFKATEEQARAGKIEIEEREFYKAFGIKTPRDVALSFAKNVAEGAADAKITSDLIEPLPEYETEIIRGIPGLGKGSRVVAYVPRYGVKAVKGLSKIAGPTAIGVYGYDVYKDCTTYEGNDRYKAVAITTGGVVVTAGIVALAVGTLPVWATVIIGAGVAVGMDYIGDKAKQTYLGRP